MQQAHIISTFRQCGTSNLIKDWPGLWSKRISLFLSLSHSPSISLTRIHAHTITFYLFIVHLQWHTNFLVGQMNNGCAYFESGQLRWWSISALKPTCHSNHPPNNALRLNIHNTNTPTPSERTVHDYLNDVRLWHILKSVILTHSDIIRIENDIEIVESIIRKCYLKHYTRMRWHPAAMLYFVSTCI